MNFCEIENFVGGSFPPSAPAKYIVAEYLKLTEVGFLLGDAHLLWLYLVDVECEESEMMAQCITLSNCDSGDCDGLVVTTKHH